MFYLADMLPLNSYCLFYLAERKIIITLVVFINSSKSNFDIRQKKERKILFLQT